MAVHKKESENGWFYHAPAKRQTNEQVFAPPASQIPGLSDLLGEPEEPKTNWIKESDTKYIRMCKAGGRPDLLQMRAPKPKPNEPQGYPRVDWFYLEDNRAEDDAIRANERWEFKLPEYMVHDHYQPNGPDTDDSLPYRPKRLPYARDTKTIYESESVNPTNKDVKIPELKKQGYGVRTEKLDRRPQRMAKQQPKEKMMVPKNQLEVEKNRPRYEAMPLPNITERPSMQKILAYSYQRDWKSNVDQYQAQQAKNKEQYEKSGVREERKNTEYSDQISRSAGKSKQNSMVPKDRKAHV